MMSSAINNRPVKLPESRKQAVARDRFQAVVQIIELERGHVRGFIRGIDGAMGIPFQDMGGLMLILDDMVDSAQTPFPRTAWASVQNSPHGFTGSAQKKPLVEMGISILYRQHFSLQGQIRVRGIPETCNFRSALELLHIIQSTVCDHEGYLSEN